MLLSTVQLTLPQPKPQYYVFRKGRRELLSVTSLPSFKMNNVSFIGS